MKRSMLALLALVICGLLLGGCSTTPNNSTTNNPTSNTTTNHAPLTPASGSKIGVAECDEYLAKYEACVNTRIPEAMRASFRDAIKTSRESFEHLAQTEDKTSLAQNCQSALETTKQSLVEYNCQW